MRKRVSHCAFCVDADQRDARRVQALGVSDEQYAGEYLQKGHSQAGGRKLVSSRLACAVYSKTLF